MRESVILYSLPECQKNTGSPIAPDIGRLKSIPLDQTVILVALLTGTAERIHFTPSGDCLIPIEPDGSYAPFCKLDELFNHVDGINNWLNDAAYNRGNPKFIPTWLTQPPLASNHLLTAITKRIATSRSISIELRDQNGQMATITIPPKQALTPSQSASQDLPPARISGTKRFATAVDRSGEIVHLPIDTSDDSCPSKGDVMRVDRKDLYRDKRLRANQVKVRPKG